VRRTTQATKMTAKMLKKHDFKFKV
jgi:hypothetical protein